MINKHKSNKIKENSNTVRHLNNGTDHRHSKSCCDQSSPARRTIMEKDIMELDCNRPSKVTVVVRNHYREVIMGTMASQITSLAIVYSIIYSGADQRINQSSAALAFVREIHWWPVNSPHKRPVTRKMLPSDDVIMITWYLSLCLCCYVFMLMIWI